MSSGLKIKIIRRSLYEDQEITNMKDKEFLVGQIKRDFNKIKELCNADFTALSVSNFDDFKPQIQSLSRTKYFHHYFKVLHKQKPLDLRIYSNGVEFLGSDYTFDDIVLDNFTDSALVISTKSDSFELAAPGERIKKVYENYLKILTRGEYRAVVLQDFTDPHNKIIQRYTTGTVIQISPDNFWGCLEVNDSMDWVPIQILQPIFTNSKAIDVFTVKYLIRKYRDEENEPNEPTLRTAQSTIIQSNERNRRSVGDPSQANPMRSVDPQLAKELDQYHFIDYAIKYFFKQDTANNNTGTLRRAKTKSTTDWGNQTTVELVKFSKQVVKGPLTMQMCMLKDKDDAIDTFTNIMIFMGDLPNDRINKEEAAMNVLKACKRYPELLEEIIAQVIKQTTNNRGIGDSEQRGWYLIKLICIFTKPPKNIELYLKRHCISIALNTTKSWNTVAEDCLKFLKLKETIKDRLFLPTVEEFAAIINGKPVSLPVHIGSQPQTFEVDVFATIGELLDMIANKIDMKDELYNISTVCGVLPEGEVIVPDDHQYVLDVFSQLKSIAVKGKLKDLNVHRLTLTKILWKVPAVIPSSYMEFSQAAASVVLGKWITSTDFANNKDKLIDMFAILGKYRDSTEKDIPSLFSENMNKELMQLRNDVFKKISFYNSYTKDKLHDAYIMLASNLKLYGGFSYYMAVPDYPKTKKEAMVTVNAKGLYIHETSKFEEILFVPYSKILNTRFGDTDVMITHGDLIKKTTVKLVTSQGPVLNAL
eukprot:NODE_100_length_20777_cov_0.240884.p1 type:complete len:760 gc:universal NODE_100_length_20777_cov_0.240884:5663-3384(-)